LNLDNNAANGCEFIIQENSGFQSLVPSPTPSPSTNLLLAAPIDQSVFDAPQSTTNNNNNILNNLQQLTSNTNNNNVNSNNKLISSSGLGGVAMLIGAFLMACACCFAAIFGLATNYKTQKKKDRLVEVIDNAPETMSQTVESRLFQGADVA
jgi:hypothetical protein